MRNELRLAWRSLRRSGWYAVTCSVVFAFGIVLTTLTVAVVDGVLFKPLPYRESEQLYLIRADWTSAPQAAPRAVSWDEITAWRAAVPDLLIGVARTTVTARVEELGATTVFETRVDEHLFRVLGVEPLIGGFAPDDHKIGSGRSVAPRLISHRLWQAAYARDRNVVGRFVLTNETRGQSWGYRIVGVLPPTFVFPTTSDQAQPDIFTPTGPPRPTGGLNTADTRLLQAIIRIPSPDDLPRVRAQLLAATRELARRTAPVAVPFDDVSLVPLAQQLGAKERLTFRMAFSAAAILLVLACVNVAGLTVAHSAARSRELVLRRALGATRWRLARYQLAELVLLLVPASVITLVLVRPLLTFTVALLPPSLVLLKVPAVDSRVVFATVLAIGGSAVLTALWPLHRLRYLDLAGGLAGRARADTPRGHSSRWLIIGETATGFVLLTAGALTIGSLVEAFGRFSDTRHEASSKLWSARDRLARIRGVEEVAISSVQPLFRSAATRPFTLWAPREAPDDVAGVASRSVTANFFQVMRLDLVEGNLPSDALWDADGPVAVVSESAARHWWPSRSALGQTLVRRSPRGRELAPPKTVVAVVRDARYSALDVAPIPDIYVPAPIRDGVFGAVFLVRTSRSVEAVMPEMLRAFAAERFMVQQADSFEGALFKSIRYRALLAWFFGLFGVCALAIVAAGIFGLLAMSVSYRVRELGVRIALGSTRVGIVRLLVLEQMRMVGVGLAMGMAVAFWSSQLLQNQLYGVSPHQASIWLAVVALVLMTTLVGATVPSLRIISSDPVRALRTE
jgi:predicted permease